jgi:hypothetical protein
MDNHTTTGDADDLARRMLNRIWNGLPEERNGVEKRLLTLGLCPSGRDRLE